MTFESKDFISKCKQFTDEYFNGLFEETKDKFYYRYKELDERRNNLEADNIKQAKDRIDKIVKKDNFFLKYMDLIKNKTFSPKDFEFKDMEEQWGFFLSKLDNINDDKKKDEEFEKFKNYLQKENGNMKNSGFICQKIQDLLKDCIQNEENASINENLEKRNKVDLAKNKKEILDLCNMDIKTNRNNYSFAPYYYRAIYYLLFEKDSSKAEDELKTAKKMAEEYKNSLRELYCYLIYGSGQNDYKYKFISKYVENKMIFYNNIINGLLEPTIEKVKETKKPILKKTTLRNYFNQSDFNDYITELFDEGFNLIFVIYERISLVRFALHFFSGIMKITIGSVALLALNAGPLLNGVKEIMQSIENLFGN